MITYKDPDTNYMCKCSLPSSVPSGISYREVPSHERDEFNEAISDYDAQGKPIFDLTKAKAIVHEKRRAKRTTDFKPYDDIITLQIPGSDDVAAEAARLVIRNADAVLQQDIDLCINVDELRTIVVVEGL
jgi:hypothetical protein